MPRIPFIRDLKNQQKKKQISKPPLSISQSIYNRQRWKKLRDAYIAENPLCEKCLQNGKTVPGEEIHHVIPFLTGQTQQEIENLAYDWNNLMSVCDKCHKELHKELGGYGHYNNLD